MTAQPQPHRGKREHDPTGHGEEEPKRPERKAKACKDRSSTGRPVSYGFFGKENPFSLQSARCERLGQSSCGVPSIIYKQTPCCCRTVELLLMEHGWPESRQSGSTKINVRGYREMRCKPWKTSAHVLAAGKRPTAALLTHGPEFE